MTKPLSQLYRGSLPEVEKQINSAIEQGCRESDPDPVVFFRADDIGIPSRQFTRLISSFKKHRLPLCLATVPAWLNGDRLYELQNITGASKKQWCWHQHGYVHHNYEPAGKYQEFGPARNIGDITASLARGKNRLDQLLGPHNQPIFTPPWNRCNQDTLQALEQLNFKAVSRSRGAKPQTLRSLPDFQVNVDLHTRKETSPEQSLHNLLEEIKQGLTSGQCGVMLHHQRMNTRAVALLDVVLCCLKKHPGISFVHFTDLLP